METCTKALNQMMFYSDDKLTVSIMHNAFQIWEKRIQNEKKRCISIESVKEKVKNIYETRRNYTIESNSVDNIMKDELMNCSGNL